MHRALSAFEQVELENKFEQLKFREKKLTESLSEMTVLCLLAYGDQDPTATEQINHALELLK